MSSSPSTEAKPLTRRARMRQATTDEIKTLARRQLDESGPGALSLRAISREMGMASSALYRYFASQDELISALIVDAYDSVAQALAVAGDEWPADDRTGRMWAVFHAHRRWALDNPSHFALIFGTPVPGYAAAPEVTGPAAGRYAVLLTKDYAAAVQSGAADPGRTHVPESFQVGESFHTLLEGIPTTYSPRQAGIVLNAWASVRGFWMTEIFGSLDRLVDDRDQLFDAHVRAVLIAMGFQPDLVDAISSV